MPLPRLEFSILAVASWRRALQRWFTGLPSQRTTRENINTSTKKEERTTTDYSSAVVTVENINLRDYLTTNHRLIDILNSPNSIQNVQEFALSSPKKLVEDPFLFVSDLAIKLRYWSMGLVHSMSTQWMDHFCVRFTEEKEKRSLQLEKAKEDTNSFNLRMEIMNIELIALQRELAALGGMVSKEAILSTIEVSRLGELGIRRKSTSSDSRVVPLASFDPLDPLDGPEIWEKSNGVWRCI